MNKNIYIYVVLSENICKCHLFYPKNQSITITDIADTMPERVSKALNNTLDILIKLNLNYPIILQSNEPILTNILNDKNLKGNVHWGPLINKIINYKFQLTAYTSD